MLNSPAAAMETVADERPTLFSVDRRAVVSANGKRHLLLPSKYPDQPLIDRLPYLKRAKAKGSFYYYFKSGPRGSEVFIRLPDIKAEDFAWAYQCKLAEIDGETPPVIRRNDRWQVYFIGCDDGPIKIGTSINVQRRIAGIQSHCPFKLSLLAVISGGHNVENSFHRKFASSRLHGEWFERTPELLAEIERLQKEGHPMTEGTTMPAEREAIVRIAKGLTEAQRRILPSFKDWRSAFEAGLNSNNSLEVMRRQGLLVREGGHDGKLAPVTNYYYALSDIGEAVRDHLEESTHE